MSFLIINRNRRFDDDQMRLYQVSEEFNIAFSSSFRHLCVPGRNFFAGFIGTPIYKGVPFDNILNIVSQQFLEGRLAYAELKGNYIFVFAKDGVITILCDSGRQHKVFFDKKSNSISNSFQMLVDSSADRYRLNRLALYERIAVGYNIGEDTLFEEIVSITPNNCFLLKKQKVQYVSEPIPDPRLVSFHRHGISRSLDQQAFVLTQYFELIEQTFAGQIGDLGLSGGFDCRLLLSLANNSLTEKLHLHTHSTSGVHEGQAEFAAKLAGVYGADLTRIPTTSPLDLEDKDLRLMLERNLSFFDARSARHLGAFSQTYTESYKAASMGNATFSLNGLGGEIYRDSYFTGRKKMTWDEWAGRYLFLELTPHILPKNTLRELSIYLREKILRELKWDRDYYDILFTHSYYGLIKMPQCNGNLVSAYNKVSPFLLPFVEPDNVLEALRAIPYLGVGGQYQAKLISKISPELANISTSYGGTFKNLSWRYLAWSMLKTWGSSRKRQRLVTEKLIKKFKSQKFQHSLEELRSRQPLKEAFNTMNEIIPDVDIDLALVDSTQRRNLIFLAFSLYHYSSKIES